MTIGRMRVGSALALMLSLGLLAGCSRKTSPRPAVEEEQAPSASQDTEPPADDKHGGDGSKTDALDAVELTRAAGRTPEAVRGYVGKVVQIEGVVAEVDLKPDGQNPPDAEVTLRGATEEPNRNRHVRISCSLRDRDGAARIGPGQKVTLQGTFHDGPRLVMLFDARLVKAGPVALTQVEIDRRRKKEPRAIVALERFGAEVRTSAKRVEEVRLNDDQLTDEGHVRPEVLDQMEKLAGSETLRLRDTRISDAGLACVKRLPYLGGLDLDGTGISDAGLAHLKDSRSLRALLVCSAQQARRSPVGNAGLAHLKGLNLEQLTLEKANVTDAGLAHLAGFHELLSLHLSDNKITDAGLAHLAGLDRLQFVELNDTQVTGGGFAHFRRMANLYRLYLANCPLTDDALEPLASLPRLADLDLRGTPITDAGLRHLEKLKSLRTLLLSKRSKATPQGIERLKAALPELTVAVADD